MKELSIKNLKKGSYFRLTASESAPVWIRGEYVKELKAYSCAKYDDVNHEKFFKDSKIVISDFPF